MQPRLPKYLAHYYEASIGPFINLSDYPPNEAEKILERIRQTKSTFASRRDGDYLKIRRELEERVRDLFIQKGGCPVRARPHYMMLGICEWAKTWYDEGAELRIPLTQFSPEIVSFTYGDTFPAMRYQDDKIYRGQVYTLAEIRALVAEFGLPQEQNPKGALGPDRYIEAQIWSDTPLRSHFPWIRPNDF
jgi:hypothetical protein